MGKYVLKRIALMFVSFFVIMTMCFVLIRLLPNPIQVVQGNFAEATRAMRKAWGYDEPLIVQYGIFLKNVFTKFDWGFLTTVGPYLHSVSGYVLDKLPATLIVNFSSIIFSIPLGILFGAYAALKKNKWQDQVISVVIMLFISVPSYVYAFLVQYFLGFKLGWFPIVMKSGTNWLSLSMLHSIVLPALSLGFGTMAGLMRYTRAELTESLTSEYMLLARAKGLTRSQATWHHAFRNSLVPIMPLIVSEIFYVLSGSIIIEQIFGVPGVGKLLLTAIDNLDYNLFLFLSMFYVMIGLICNIIIDLCYGVIDPRIRMGGGKTNEG